MCEFSFTVIFAVYFFARVGQWCQLSIHLSESSLNKLYCWAVMAFSSWLLGSVWQFFIIAWDFCTPPFQTFVSIRAKCWWRRLHWKKLSMTMTAPTHSWLPREKLLLKKLQYMSKLNFQFCPVFCIGEPFEGHSGHKYLLLQFITVPDGAEATAVLSSFELSVWDQDGKKQPQRAPRRICQCLR